MSGAAHGAPAMPRAAFLLCLPLAAALAAGAGKSFRADFEDAKPGGLPKGWSAAITGEGKAPVWKVIEDRSAPKGTKALMQTSVSPNTSFNLCIADGTSFKDVEIAVAYKAI